MKTRGNFKLILPIGLMVVAANSFAQPAVQSVTTAGPVFKNEKTFYPWRDGNYRECGQACLYKKANENLTMQMLYTLNLIEDLEGKNTINPPTASDKADALKGFCYPGEGGEDCFTRYKARAKLLLLGLRRSIVENKAMVGKLKVRKGERFGSSELVRGVLPTMMQLQNQLGGLDEVSKFAQAPSTLTLEQLTAYYNQEFNNINFLVSQEYEQWSKEVPFEPAPTDFIKFKEVKRDPRDPESETIVVVETNCSGNRLRRSRTLGSPIQGSPDEICYDEAKYKKAKEDYLAQVARAQGKASGGKIANWGTSEALAYEQRKKTGFYAELPPGKTIGSPIAQGAYTNARRALVRALRKARGEEIAAEQKKKAGVPEFSTIDSNQVIDSRKVQQATQQPDPDEDTEPAPQRGTAAKDLSVSIQPRDAASEPGAKDQFLDETLAIDPSQ